MSTAIEKIQQQSGCRAVQTLADIQTTAKVMAESGLFPAWNTPAKMMTLMLLCQSEGCDPVRAVNRYDNIQGRVCKRPQAMLEDFLNAGGKVKWETLSDKEATAVFTPPGGDPFRHSYTWEEAMRAGNVTKENYRKYPMEMLRSRLIGRALRTIWPAATNTMYTPEEVVGGGVPLESLPLVEPAAAPAASMFSQSASAASVVAEPVAEAQAVPGPPVGNTGEHAVFQPLRDMGGGKAQAYLRSIGWLKDGDELEALSDRQCNMIYKKLASFQQKVAAYVVPEAPIPDTPAGQAEAAAQAEGGAK